MSNSASPFRTYIVYHHGLFAQGVRSVLETRRTIQVVGMESDVGKALKAVRALQPEVIIMEECTGKYQAMRLGAFLHSATAGRVVTLSLDHQFATTYQRSRSKATDPTDLVKAIRGVGKQRVPRLNQSHGKASTSTQPGSDREGSEALSGRTSRVRDTRKQGTQDGERLSRTSRGSKKGR